MCLFRSMRNAEAVGFLLSVASLFHHGGGEFSIYSRTNSFFPVLDHCSLILAFWCKAGCYICFYVLLHGLELPSLIFLPHFLSSNFFLCGQFKKSLLNLIQYCFCLMFWLFGHEACRIVVLHQGWNLHPLCWKAKSQPLDHEGSLSHPFSFWFCISEA